MAQMTLEEALADLPTTTDAANTTVPSAEGTAEPMTLEDAMSGLGDGVEGMSLEDALSDMDPEAEAPAPELTPYQTRQKQALTPGYYVENGEEGLGHPSPGPFALATAAEGLILGGTAGALEVRDLFMDEPEGGRPELDAVRKRYEEQSPIIGPAATAIGQFAVGIFGLKGAGAAVKALPWFGKGLKAGETALRARRGGALAAELGRDATALFITSDPHTERLANLLEGTPYIGPVAEFLAADPEDGVAEGRMKAALEGMAMDVALRTVLVGSVAGFKALWFGNAEKAAEATAEAEATLQRIGRGEDLEASTTVPEGTPDAPTGAGTSADPSVLDLDGIGHEVDLEAGGLGGTELPRAAAADVPDADGPAPSATPEAQALEPELSVPEAATVPGDMPPALRLDDATAVPGSPSSPSAIAVRLSDEDTDGLLAAMRSDAEALSRHGSRQAAVNAGHRFGEGESIPYAKLTDAEEVNAFLARVVDAEEDRIVTAKGGAVVHDADVQRIAADRAKLFGEDPTAFLGMVRGSAEASRQMVANAEAGRFVINRLATDLTEFARLLSFEDYSMFGSKALAYEAFAKRYAVLGEVYASTSAITSNSARATRLAGVRLTVDPSILGDTSGLDIERLIGAFANSDGSARSIAKLAKPSLFAKAIDLAKYVYVNNLISGWKTVAVNALSNSYMVGVRPLERMLGATPTALAGNAGSRTILREALRQYAYTTTAFIDGFQSAVRTLRANDSILSPHSTELYRRAQGPAQGLASPTWKPWDTPAGTLHNVFASIAPKAALNAIGLPTRINGFMDEMTKQTVYRSKVMAKAHVGAVEEANRLKLTGPEAKTFVREYVADKLAAAFDDAGRGLDRATVEEAEVATFSQDLLPGTWGQTVQMAKMRHPGLTFILPFTKTPTNILRYGWKMTPGLNLLQEEYRQMLKGAMGAEKQAQAIGQVALGTSAILATASLASMGSITGGGPKDPKLRQELLATGWQPYSVVVERDDGTRSYYSYGRLDPIAVPMGIVADLQDAMHVMDRELEDTSGMEAVATGSLALAVALTKQFTSKSYMTGFSQFIDAIADPEQRLGPLGGQMASNFVPFASMLRQTDTDPYMREARDFVDKIMDTVPGIGATLPARYDAFGDPMTSRNGLWSSDKASLVDREMQRLVLENGKAPTRVSPTPQAGVDLRDITIAEGTFAGRNAYEVYQHLGGHLPDGAPALKDLVAQLMEGERYRIAPDGDAGTAGTKLSILTGLMSDYRREAMRRLKQDPAVGEAFTRRERKVEDAYRERAKSGAVMGGSSAAGAKAAGGTAKGAGTAGTAGTGRPGIGEAFGVETGEMLSGEAGR